MIDLTSHPDVPHTDEIFTVEGRSFVELNAFQIESGWPLHSLRAVDNDFASQVGVDPWPDTPFGLGGGRTVQIGAHTRVIPLVPKWTGFATDSAVFGAFVLIVLTVFRASTIAYRAKRGACVRCRYPLGDLITCPECGTRSLSALAAIRTKVSEASFSAYLRDLRVYFSDRRQA
jgi:hypothetical protein